MTTPYPARSPDASPSAIASTINTFEVIPVPAFNDNYIWLLVARKAGESPDATPSCAVTSSIASAGSSSSQSAGVALRDVIVVDPGQAQPVIDVLEAQSLRLSAILLTHHHNDHVGGVAQLLAYAARAAEHAADAADASANPRPGAVDPVPVYGPAGEEIVHVTHKLVGDDVVVLSSPNAHFRVIDVPGHTRGHIAFFAVAPSSDACTSLPAAPPRVFCGDTLFATGCGRLFEGTPAQMLTSLDRLATLPPETQVHCAHEYTLSNIRFALACDSDNVDLNAWRSEAEALRDRGEPTVPTTLAHELRVNPFLRADAPAILARLTEVTGQMPVDRLAAFTALRAWKDKF